MRVSGATGSQPGPQTEPYTTSSGRFPLAVDSATLLRLALFPASPPMRLLLVSAERRPRRSWNECWTLIKASQQVFKG